MFKIKKYAFNSFILSIFLFSSLVLVISTRATAESAVTKDSTAKEDTAKESTENDALTSCLKSWGNHPFGNKLKYKTLSTSVTVFGLGDKPSDKEVTKEPALILVNPGVNVMGGTTYELLNPNGWYCFRSNVNVMGGVIIKAHCNARLASAHDGATVMGSSESKGVTVMGKTKVEQVDCKK